MRGGLEELETPAGLGRLGVPDLMNHLIAAGHKPTVAYVTGHWLDVDDAAAVGPVLAEAAATMSKTALPFAGAIAGAAAASANTTSGTTRPRPATSVVVNRDSDYNRESTSSQRGRAGRPVTYGVEAPPGHPRLTLLLGRAAPARVPESN